MITALIWFKKKSNQSEALVSEANNCFRLNVVSNRLGVSSGWFDASRSQHLGKLVT